MKLLCIMSSILQALIQYIFHFFNCPIRITLNDLELNFWTKEGTWRAAIFIIMFLDNQGQFVL